MPFRPVELCGQSCHGARVEIEHAMRIAARCEEEHGAANGTPALVVGDEAAAGKPGEHRTQVALGALDLLQQLPVHAVRPERYGASRSRIQPSPDLR